MKQAVSQFLLVIASSRRERGNLYGVAVRGHSDKNPRPFNELAIQLEPISKMWIRVHGKAQTDRESAAYMGM